MSLQRKFAVLLLLFVLVVAFSLGTAYQFGVVLERELVWPFETLTRIRKQTAELERTIGLQQELLVPISGPSQPDENSAPSPSRQVRVHRYEQLTDTFEAHFAELMKIPRFEQLAGAATVRNLIERARKANDMAQFWLKSNSSEDVQTVRRSLSEIVALLRRMDEQFLASSEQALAYSDSLRVTHRIVLISGITASALLGLLGALLMKRWVARPVQALRLAAIELGKGHLEHRITTQSGDELGQLSNEINEMAQTISDMQEEALQRERLAAVGEMVRRLAHNIRNPLAGIRNLAELTRRQSADNTTIITNQTDIIQAVDRFNDWLSRLLDVSSPLAIRTQPTPFTGWLNGLIASQLPLARMREVAINTDVDGAPPIVEIDPRHMEDACVAILTNAIQASSPGSSVRITASPRNSGERWGIDFEDSGAGVPDHLRTKIFQPYFTTKRDGNGIGLAVAHEVVRLHGGHIVVESAPDGGARFMIDLPLVAVTQDASVDLSQSAEINHSGE